jgi:pyruvate formate lyase activating enzyme
MIEARYFQVISKDTIKCNLCPHYCNLSSGERGKCGVRKNVGGKLIAESYGIVSSVHLDPIEKKPLYHYYPGASILSIGSVGCNLSCSFCQNCDISQTTVDDYPWLREHTIDQVLSYNDQYSNNLGLAYTYNEPTVYFEFMIDLAKEVKKQGFKNAMISNGYVAEKPLDEVLELIDAFNIDLKAFNNEFYKKFTDARLKPVKENLKKIRNAGKHLEITNLIIPTLNDDANEFEEMVKWIYNELGSETILHLSKYFPAYRLHFPPTPLETIAALFEISKSYLPYTYTGNLSFLPGQNTVCPKCSTLLIERKSGYETQIKGLDKHGKCRSCGIEIIKHIQS